MSYYCQYNKCAQTELMSITGTKAVYTLIKTLIQNTGMLVACISLNP